MSRLLLFVLTPVLIPILVVWVGVVFPLIYLIAYLYDLLSGRPSRQKCEQYQAEL
jgi:hypothetical protein